VNGQCGSFDRAGFAGRAPPPNGDRFDDAVSNDAPGNAEGAAVLPRRMPDLVIGARRSAPRPWRAGAIAIALVGVAVIVAWVIFRRSVTYDMPSGEVTGDLVLAQQPGQPPRLSAGSASLEWSGGIALIRTSGDAHAIGAAQGRLLAALIPAPIAAERACIEATVDDDGWLGGTTHDMRLAWRWRLVDDGLADADRRMVAGLVRGARASGVTLGYADALRAQAVLDVGEPAPGTGELAIAHSLVVVAPQAQAPARVWVGRAFALPGVGDGGDSAVPVVTLAHPDGALAYAAVGWPGELGAITGINAQAIAVLVAPARTADVRTARAARPLALLARAVLEHAKTLDDAARTIEQTATLGAGVFVLVDGDSGHWMVVERTPSKTIVEKSPRSPATGDVLVTHELAADPENDRARRMTTTQARVERAAHLAHAPLPDVGAMAAILRDARGEGDAPRALGSRLAIDDARQIQQVIIDPTSLELWVADPHAGGRMRAFDLRHELRGEGDRAAPPADLAADAAADPEAVSALREARALLREARVAIARGQRVRASELVARALARAPTLPEAIELDATLARSHGDDNSARALYQRWIDDGPDDPAGEEQARASLAR
jgi:hypothetical protein